MPEELDLLQFFEVQPSLYSPSDRLWKIDYASASGDVEISHSAIEKSFQVILKPKSGGNILYSFEGLESITFVYGDARRDVIATGSLGDASIQFHIKLLPEVEIVSGILEK